MQQDTYPSGHPYSWNSPSGSMEDLTAASLNDVKEWFRTFYGPSTPCWWWPATWIRRPFRKKVEAYFGRYRPARRSAGSVSGSPR